MEQKITSKPITEIEIEARKYALECALQINHGDKAVEQAKIYADFILGNDEPQHNIQRKSPTISLALQVEVQQQG
jgi:hypothetical protein